MQHLYLPAFVESDDPVWKGYFFTALICSVTFINSTIYAQLQFRLYLLGLKIRVALSSAVYKKAVVLSNVGRKEMTGE
jgi:ATP-binding cassette subfamily C (CFTR/MRP) protein 1